MNLYGKLTFDGYTFPNYQIVTVKDNGGNKFGVSRSVETEDSSIGIPLFTKFKNNTVTLSFDLIKVDNTLRNPLPFSKSEIQELQRRLFSKNSYGVLQAKEKDNLLFYGAFVGNPEETFLGGISYISLEFQLASPYCYSSIMTEEYRVVGERNIEIINKSNANEEIYADIYIEFEEGNEVEITNPINHSLIKISGVEDKEKVYIYGDTKEFISKVDSTRNIYKLSNRKAMKLAYGTNRINIKARDVKIKFIYQYEMQLF